MTLVHYILIAVAGVLLLFAFKALIETIAESGISEKKTYAGTMLIHKNEEAIDGQIQFTKDLWTISELKEVTFKVKILPGEPGEWESKK